MTWELIWMLIILKVPVVYLCLVVWWAVRAKPVPLEPALLPARTEIDPKPGWDFLRARRRPRRGPHGSPSRGYRRQVAHAKAELQ
jgi:hypothetical protein